MNFTTRGNPAVYLKELNELERYFATTQQNQMKTAQSFTSVINIISSSSNADTTTGKRVAATGNIHRPGNSLQVCHYSSSSTCCFAKNDAFF